MQHTRTRYGRVARNSTCRVRVTEQCGLASSDRLVACTRPRITFGDNSSGRRPLRARIRRRRRVAAPRCVVQNAANNALCTTRAQTEGHRQPDVVRKRTGAPQQPPRTRWAPSNRSFGFSVSLTLNLRGAQEAAGTRSPARVSGACGRLVPVKAMHAPTYTPLVGWPFAAHATTANVQSSAARASNMAQPGAPRHVPCWKVCSVSRRFSVARTGTISTSASTSTPISVHCTITSPWATFVSTIVSAPTNTLPYLWWGESVG